MLCTIRLGAIIIIKRWIIGDCVKMVSFSRLLCLSRLQPGPYSWSRDSRHTCGRRYTGTLGRSHTGTFGRNHWHTRKEPPTVHASDFRLSIKPGIPLSRILVLRSSTNIIPDPILHPGTVIMPLDHEAELLVQFVIFAFYLAHHA
jgi:hypothetical protein